MISPTKPDRVADAIRAFTQRHPDIFVEIRTASADLVTQLVVDGTADLGINVVLRVLPELTAHALFSQEMVPCCGAGHPLFHVPSGEITFDMLMRYEWVDLALPSNAQLSDRAAKLQVTSRAGNMEARLLLIQTGRYIGLLPRELVRSRAPRDQIRIIESNAFPAKRICSAVFRRNAGTNVARQQLFDDLKRVFQTPARTAPAPRPWRGNDDLAAKYNAAE